MALRRGADMEATRRLKEELILQGCRNAYSEPPAGGPASLRWGSSGGGLAMLEAGGGALGRVDAVIDKAVAEKRLVGAVVLIAYDGKLVHRRAAGLDNRERRSQMSAERIFRLSSLTKPIVSAAAMALAERGKLHLDDAITRWLPDFRPQLSDGRAPAITLRQ